MTPTQPTEQELQQLEVRRQYITTANINAMVSTRNLKVNLMMAQMAQELLPDTAAHLRSEFLGMAAMMETLLPKEPSKQ